MNIKKVTLMLEDTTEVPIDVDHILELDMYDVVETHMLIPHVIKYHKCHNMTLRIKDPDLMTFVDNKYNVISIYDRLEEYKDITGIMVVYDDNTYANYIVDYAGDTENANQKNTFVDNVLTIKVRENIIWRDK